MDKREIRISESRSQKYSTDTSTRNADNLLEIGNNCLEIDQINDALKYYENALKLYSTSKDLIGEGYALTGIGMVHEKYKEYAKSRMYYEKALNKFQKTKDCTRVKILSKLIANTYKATNTFEDNLIEYRSIEIVAKKQIMFLLFYLIIIIIAELITTYINIEVGLIIHATVLTMLLIHGSLERSHKFSFLLLSMMAIPIIRIIGLTMPIMQTPALYWFPLISIPLLAATFTIARAQKISRKNLGLTFGNIPIQICIALTGIIIGFIEYQILQPKPLISYFSIESVLLAGFILLISTGLAEELIFRGIIQKNAENILGNFFGLLYTSLLFTALHIGWNSILDWILVFFVAMFYGYIFQRTKSLFGITLSHGISNSVLFLIMPFLTF